MTAELGISGDAASVAVSLRIFGAEVSVTSVQLRMIADLLQYGDPAAWPSVFALPKSYLAQETVERPPWHVANRLRGIARFLERWDTGLAFKYPHEEWDRDG